MQIKVECDKFGHTSDIKNTVVYGGASKRNRMMDLQKGVDIVIATPGKLQ
jgi:ATP-dependent RNA helicase DDX5/DBP2